MKSTATDDAPSECKIKTFLKPFMGEDTLPAPAARPAAPVRLSLPSGSYQLVFAENIDSIADRWRSLAPSGRPLQSVAYLRVLEKAPPTNMMFGYLLIERDNETVGGAMLQFVDFNARRHIRDRRKGQPVSGWKGRLKNLLAGRLHFRVMICGNLLLTGNHGVILQAPISDRMELLSDALEAVAAHTKGSCREVQAFIIKELPLEQRKAAGALRNKGYHHLFFQPNMIMDIPPAWDAFDDYLSGLSSKYRVRARRAFKKARPVERRELQLPEIEGHRSLLHRLYLEIADRADFNMTILSPDYLPLLKKAFPERFHLYGYFLDEKLIGYHTTIHNGSTLEAHLLGFRAEVNYQYQLYLNMLYEIIEEAIERDASEVGFARTALEIKSSVGAKPKPMAVFLKSSKGWFNAIVPWLVKYLAPREEWTQRHPFKVRQ